MARELVAAVLLEVIGRDAAGLQRLPEPLLHRTWRAALVAGPRWLLVVQAAREGLRLLSSDRTLASYGDPVQWVAG